MMIRWLLLIVALWLVSCSKEEGPSGPAPVQGKTHLAFSVFSAEDSVGVDSAEVTLFYAVTQVPVGTAVTDGQGRCWFYVDTGSYFVRIAAQGFYSLPPATVAPVPFHTSQQDTLYKQYYLDTLGSVAGLGTVSGYVFSDSTEGKKPLPSILVLAQDVLNGKKYSATSGVTGRFTLFNLPYGTYNLYAYASGYALVDTPRVVLQSPHGSDTLSLQPVSGGRLTGGITFLASQNADSLDITLLDSASGAVIPGLSTWMDSTKKYLIAAIPTGRFLVWASYKNDGYVMDPDWLFKSGYPMVSFHPSDTLHIQPFSVTGAITLSSPTNAADTLLPVWVDSVRPRLTWVKYPSAKEYILEVSDMSGRVVWGGFNRSDSTVRHQQIAKEDSSVVFNFDNSAVQPLIPGRVYRWKVFADSDANPKVQKLISSSEDLRGLFMVK